MEIKYKSIFKSVINYLVTTTNGMAIGLFGTLIIGVIIDQIGNVFNSYEIIQFAKAVKGLMGAGIGLGVALSLKKEGIYAVTGMAAGYLSTQNLSGLSANTFSDPLCCYIGCILSLGVLTLIMRRKTPVDILLIPLIGLTTALLFSWFISGYVHQVTVWIGLLVEQATDYVPFFMTIVISVVMGMALTAPISSAAIAISLNLSGVAAGAALIGCSVQMVGFTVQMWRDNKIGSMIAVGVGTSMLQFKNIIRKPIIWLPTIIVSALLGPFAYFLNITTNAAGAGMGTSGLVGFITAIDVMTFTPYNFIILILFTMIIPMILVFAVDYLFYKFGLIKKGDLSLEDKAEVNSVPVISVE